MACLGRVQAQFPTPLGPCLVPALPACESPWLGQAHGPGPAHATVSPAPSAPHSSILKSHLLSLSPLHFMPSCQSESLLCLLVSQRPYVILPGGSISSRSAARRCWWPFGPLPLLQHGIPAEFGTCSLAPHRLWATIPHLWDCGEERGKAQPVLTMCAVAGRCGAGSPAAASRRHALALWRHSCIPTLP